MKSNDFMPIVPEISKTDHLDFSGKAILDQVCRQDALLNLDK